MLSVIEVKCPHCGANGQLMVPPLGSIIVGPCPECRELVAVFCGHVLPLDKKIMINGTSDARREHLMAGITDFLDSRIAKLIDDSSDNSECVANHQFGNDVQYFDDDEVTEGIISDDEIEHFKDTELQLIDNKDYFELFFS